MKIRIGIKTVSRLLALLLVIIGCSHDPKVKQYPVTANPGEEIFLLNRDMQIALNAQADVLSPKNFEKAQEHQKEANSSLKANKRPDATLKHVAVSRHYLNQAKIYSARSNMHLKGVGEARKRAIEAGAEDYYNYEITKADRKLKDLTADIERDESDEAEKDSAKTQESYLNIELMSLKKKYLDESQKIVKQARKEGAAKNAPKTLAISEKSISDSAAFITANRSDPEAMAKESQKSFRQATLLLKINRDVKSGAAASSEDMALRMNAENEKVINLNQRMAQQEQVITGNNTRITTLSSEKEAMQKKEDHDQRFEKAKNRFNANEATVYKKGDALLIRLHGLKFNSSKSELSSNNIALLNKVNLAIEDIGSKKIQVNGHTDSIGGKATNQKVSEERAAVIKNYLQGKNENEDLSIITKGFDFQQPIATNKTAEGRALNRRVDILIEPTRY